MRYILYTVDKREEVDEVIGMADAVNAYTALRKVTTSTSPLEEYNLGSLRAAMVTDVMDGGDLLKDA